MKRAYYDCPTQAAYMAKTFGIRLGVYLPNGKFHEWEHWCRCFVDGDGEQDIWPDGKKLYIHPDSMGVFKPVPWDLGMNKRGAYAFWSFCRQIWKNTQSTREVKNINKIVLRDGKPFMWPKWEESS